MGSRKFRVHGRHFNSELFNVKRWGCKNFVNLRLEFTVRGNDGSLNGLYMQFDWVISFDGYLKWISWSKFNLFVILSVIVTIHLFGTLKPLYEDVALSLLALDVIQSVEGKTFLSRAENRRRVVDCVCARIFVWSSHAALSEERWGWCWGEKALR